MAEIRKLPSNSGASCLKIQPSYDFERFTSPRAGRSLSSSASGALAMISASPPVSPFSQFEFFPSGGANEAIGLLFPGAYVEKGDYLGLAHHSFWRIGKETNGVNTDEKIYCPTSGYVSRVLCYGSSSSSSDEVHVIIRDLANRHNNIVQISNHPPTNTARKLRIKSIKIDFDLNEFVINRWPRREGVSSDSQEQDRIVQSILSAHRQAIPIERDLLESLGYRPIIEVNQLARRISKFFAPSDKQREEIYLALIDSRGIQIEAPAFLVREFASGFYHEQGVTCHEYESNALGGRPEYHSSAAMRDEIDRLENNAAKKIDIDGNKQGVFGSLREINLEGRKLWGIKEAKFRNLCVEDFSFLEYMPSIESLTIDSCPMSHAPDCGGMDGLREVNIMDAPILDVSGFAKGYELGFLRISDAPLENISVLRDSQIEELRVDRTRVADISAVGDMRYLKWLSVEDTLVADLTPLLNCSDLKSVNIRGTVAVQNDDRLSRLMERQWDDEESPFFKEMLATLKKKTVNNLAGRSGDPTENVRSVAGNIGISELEGLIGLEAVKAEIKKLVVGAQYAIKRRERGLPVDQPTLHLVFTGNPGTGKTTVARLVGNIYRDLGLLAKGHVVEVARHDLVADYLGQTAGKTTKKLEEALDGVLFIDEAYTLSPETAHQDYGREAIDAMLVFMENNRARISIIAAGYAGEMQRFIASNPGLKSRFTRYIDFEDYAVSECMDIFRKLVRDSHYNLSAEAQTAAEEAIVEIIAQEQPHFANGRSVRNLFEKVRERQNMRVVLQNVDDITVIEADDIRL